MSPELPERRIIARAQIFRYLPTGSRDIGRRLADLASVVGQSGVIGNFIDNPVDTAYLKASFTIVTPTSEVAQVSATAQAITPKKETATQQALLTTPTPVAVTPGTNDAPFTLTDNDKFGGEKRMKSIHEVVEVFPTPDLAETAEIEATGAKATPVGAQATIQGPYQINPQTKQTASISAPFQVVDPKKETAEMSAPLLTSLQAPILTVWTAEYEVETSEPT